MVTKVTVGGVDLFSESTVNGVDIEVDYTTDVGRIATALESLATSTSTIATNTTTIAQKLTLIEQYQKTITDLATGSGIHIIGPYDWVNFSTLYKLLVEQGGILDNTGNVSASQQAAAKAELEKYVSKISSLPTSF